MKTSIFKEEDLEREANELVNRCADAGREFADVTVQIRPLSPDAPHEGVIAEFRTAKSAEAYQEYLKGRKKLARARKH